MSHLLEIIILFLGWSTTKNATTATYSAGELFTIDANTTLYAIWQKAGTVAEAYSVVLQKKMFREQLLK